MNITSEKNLLKLSAQRAFLGNIPSASNLRSISVEKKGDKIKFRCIFDGEPSEADKEILSRGFTEIVADYPETIVESEEYLNVRMPSKCPDLAIIVFYRNEIE